MRTLPQNLSILAVLLVAGLSATQPLIAQDAAAEAAPGLPDSASQPLIAQDAVADAARGLLDKFKSALVVVTVDHKLIATTDGDPLPDREQQRRTLGVTIRDNGLVVISNASVDPAVGLVGQKGRMGEKMVTIQNAKTEFQKVEISYGDSTVLPGKIIRQDGAADVAFVLPVLDKAEQGKRTFTWIDFGTAKLAEPADQVVGLSRSSAAYGYMPTVIFGTRNRCFQIGPDLFCDHCRNSPGDPDFYGRWKPHWGYPRKGD